MLKPDPIEEAYIQQFIDDMKLVLERRIAESEKYITLLKETMDLSEGVVEKWKQNEKEHGEKTNNVVRLQLFLKERNDAEGLYYAEKNKIKLMKNRVKQLDSVQKQNEMLAEYYSSIEPKKDFN